MKRTLCVLLAALMMLSVAACGQQNTPQPAPAENAAGTPVAADSAVSYDKVTITASNFNAQESSYGKAMDAFKQYVEEKSGGAVTVDVYHAGALGSEKECAEGVFEGSIDLMFSGTGGIGNYIPATAAIECWFVIKDIESMQKVIAALDEDLNKAFDDAGFVFLGCFYDGPRNMCSTKEVHTINDLKGLKWRVPTSVIYTKSAEALGASAIAMPLGEVYTSLQTGAVDALEGTLDSIVTYKYYEQADYIIETAHTYQPLFMFYNKANFSSLNADTQALIREGLAYAEGIQLELWAENNATQRAFLEENGMTFISLEDRDEGVKAVDATSREYCESCGELGMKVYETINAIAAE